MHILFLILKYSPHLELQWLCTTTVLTILAAVTLDLTTILLALIAMASTALTGYFTYLVARTRQTITDTAVAVAKTTERVDEYHRSVNSKMDELLRLTRQSAHAEGVLAGAETEKQRRALEDQNKAKGAASEHAKKPDTQPKK